MSTQHLKLSYLTLSDEEDNYVSTKQDVVKGLPCNYRRCDQELICVNTTEYYCSRECYQKKVEEDNLEHRLRTDKLRFKHVTIIGRGGTGLLKDRAQLDFIHVKIDERFGRIVTVDNNSSECCIWKSTLTKTKPKDKMQAKVRRKEDKEIKEKLKGLLNCSSESSSSDEEVDDDDDDADEEDAREEIHQSIFCRGVNSSICPVPTPLPIKNVAKPVRGYVINIVSPWELYIQTAEMVRMTEKIDAICNREEGIDPRLVIENWRPEIGGFCCAKYDDKWYRARILEHLKDSFRVKYVDYGNVAVIPIEDVHQLSPELTMIPRQCIYYKVSNAKPMKGKSKWNSEVRKFTVEQLDGSCVELEVEAVERKVIHAGKVNLLSSYYGEIFGDFGDNLVKRKLAEPDSYYLS